MDKKESYEWDYVDEKAFPVNTEHKVIVYFDDNEEGRAALQQLKLKMMMLKSKEMEGLFGWDVKLGRLYVEDNIVDDVRKPAVCCSCRAPYSICRRHRGYIRK